MTVVWLTVVGAVTALAVLSARRLGIPYLEGLAPAECWSVVAGAELALIGIVAPMLHVSGRWEVLVLAIATMPIEAAVMAASQGVVDVQGLVLVRGGIATLGGLAVLASAAIAEGRFTEGECAALSGLVFAGPPLVSALLADGGIVALWLAGLSPLGLLQHSASESTIASVAAVAVAWALLLRYGGRRGARG